MTTIHWPLLAETFLLLLGAFGAGCAVACIFRRLVYAGRRPVASASVAATERAALPAAAAQPLETARFERALTGTAAERAAARPAASGPPRGTVIEVQQPAPKIAAPAPAATAAAAGAGPSPAPAAPSSRSPAPFDPAAMPAAASAPKLDAGLPGASPGMAAAAGAAAAAAAAVGVTGAAAARAPQQGAPGSAAPATAAPAPAAKAPAPQPAGGAPFGMAPLGMAPPGLGAPGLAPVGTAPAGSAAGPAPAVPADDLTLIRAIDGDMQARLNKLGVRRFSDLASWSASDVNRMSQSLGFAGRIEQENWIEQSQILAKGGETEYSRRRKAGGGQTSAAAPLAFGVSAATAASAAKAPAPPLQPAVKLEQPSAGAPAEAKAPAPPLQPAVKLEQPGVAASGPAASATDPSRSFGVMPKGAPDAAALAAAAAIAAAAAGAARTPPPPAGGAPATGVASATADRLHRILGVTADAERLLNANGVASFAQIAAWTTADIERFDRLLGQPGRISRENWIEQSQILSRGGETEYSSRQSGRASAEPASAWAAAGAIDSASGPGDRLHRILGINADAERLLIDNGVTRFAQIAAWTATDVARFDGIVGQPGRIARENWVEQAKVLARASTEGEAPRPAKLADAIRENRDQRQPSGRHDLGHLRSVRSEALRGEVQEAPRPSVLTRHIGGSDDLKRIRGIGVLIEKKLYSLGVTTYEQIANWTGADIDRISQILDFKGRIERENWIEQSRILAAGGHTEFSRRVDRGDVDGSKQLR